MDGVSHQEVKAGRDGVSEAAAQQARAGRFFALRYGWVIFLGSTVFILGFGIAVDVVMAHTLPDREWQRWSNIGQAFESVAAVFAAFGLAALVITFVMQFKELQLQRQELALQRHEMSQTQAELHRSAQADLRRLHVELLRMAIEDEGLGAVWPDAGSADHPHAVRRQLWYANLIYQHQRLAMEFSDYDENRMRPVLRRLFRSPVMRAYWAAGAEARACDLMPGTREWSSAQVVDEICREYDDDPPASEPRPAE